MFNQHIGQIFTGSLPKVNKLIASSQCLTSCQTNTIPSTGRVLDRPRNTTPLAFTVGSTKSPTKLPLPNVSRKFDRRLTMMVVSSATLWIPPFIAFLPNALSSLTTSVAKHVPTFYQRFPVTMSHTSNLTHSAWSRRPVSLPPARD